MRSPLPFLAFLLATGCAATSSDVPDASTLDARSNSGASTRVDVQSFDLGSVRVDALSSPADVSLPDLPPPPDARPSDGALAGDAPTAAHDAAPDATLPRMDPADVGVNIYDIMGCYTGWNGMTPADGRRALESVHAARLGHVRFNASGWRGRDAMLFGWPGNRELYLAAFDRLVADAEAVGVKLIPSLLWGREAFSDFHREPIQALFTPGSRTRVSVDAYLTEVASRYRTSNAILAWEITNELNLIADVSVICDQCDIPRVDGRGRCGFWEELGDPCRRTDEDNVYLCNNCRGRSETVQDITQFLQTIATTIHAADPVHPVASGHTAPRPYQRHLADDDGWVADSLADFEWAIDRLHPPAIDWVTVHNYSHLESARPGMLGPEDQIRVAARYAARTGRRLYVGELGEPQEHCPANLGCRADTTRTVARAGLYESERANAIVSMWTWSITPGMCSTSEDCLTIHPNDGLANLATLFADRRRHPVTTFNTVTRATMTGALTWTNGGRGEVRSTEADPLGTFTRVRSSRDMGATTFLLSDHVERALGARADTDKLVARVSLRVQATDRDAGAPSTNAVALRVLGTNAAGVDVFVSPDYPLNPREDSLLLQIAGSVVTTTIPVMLGAEYTLPDDVVNVRFRFEMARNVTLDVFEISARFH